MSDFLRDLDSRGRWVDEETSVSRRAPKRWFQTGRLGMVRGRQTSYTSQVQFSVSSNGLSGSTGCPTYWANHAFKFNFYIAICLSIQYCPT